MPASLFSRTLIIFSTFLIFLDANASPIHHNSEFNFQTNCLQPFSTKSVARTAAHFHLEYPRNHYDYYINEHSFCRVSESVARGFVSGFESSKTIAKCAKCQISSNPEKTKDLLMEPDGRCGISFSEQTKLVHLDQASSREMTVFSCCKEIKQLPASSTKSQRIWKEKK